MAVEAPEKPGADLWLPPILRTVSLDGTGIPELAQAIARHAAHLRKTGDWTARERARLESELDLLIREGLVSHFHAGLPTEQYEHILDQLIARRLSPWEAAASLLDGRTA
jgi:LAO/AO transport system kinase